jgi:hypothetical protein
LKLDRKYKLLTLICNDVNLLGININTIIKSTVAILVAGEDVGLEVKTEKYVFMIHQQNQNIHTSKKAL